MTRMAEHGVPIKRVINAGGIPQKDAVLNQVYANVLGRPLLMPSKSVVSLGAAIFAFLAAGTFNTVEEAQEQICPPHKEYLPEPAEQAVYEELYPLFQRLYFAFGSQGNGPVSDVLPRLIQTAQSVMARKGKT